MAKIPFVDTHVHFYDLQHPILRYDWLQPGETHPIIGNIDGIKALRYDADNYVAETRFANVVKAVHVQAAIGTADPVEETRWLEEMGERTGFPHGIVADCSLGAPGVEAELERHAAFGRLRGIRDFGLEGHLADARWHHGFSLLETFELICDLDCSWENMPAAAELAGKYPGVTVVLEHVGYPRQRTEEYFRHWKHGMRELARAENVHCKISGLGMCDPRWTIESIRPWVLWSIEVFGVERCVFGSNWPVDRLFSSYDPVIDAYASIIDDLTIAEKEALFFKNAERLYQI